MNTIRHLAHQVNHRKRQVEAYLLQLLIVIVSSAEAQVKQCARFSLGHGLVFGQVELVEQLHISLKSAHDEASSLVFHVLLEDVVLACWGGLSLLPVSQDALKDAEWSSVLVSEHTLAELCSILKVSKAAHLKDKQVETLHALQVYAAGAVWLSKVFEINLICRIEVEFRAEVYQSLKSTV